MRTHVLQHVPFEDIGAMGAWLETRGARVTYTHFYQSPELPEPGGLDLVIAMGGPMSVNDESSFPWLRAEKSFIRDAVQRRIPVLGVCLGAQLIASALGARVYRGPHREIGWFPIEGTPEEGDAFRFPGRCTVFHWHGETFDLPPGALRLAGSAAYKNQAFQIGRFVIGLQFHLEATPESVQALLDHSGDEVVPGPYVQSVSEIRGAIPGAYEGINERMAEVLRYLTPE